MTRLVKVKKYRNPRITKSAEGEPCTLRLSVCNGDWTTTVWAHSPYEEDGHGTGTKSHDIFGCYACSACHDELDGRAHKVRFKPDEKYDIFQRAMKKSWLRLLQKGVLK